MNTHTFRKSHGSPQGWCGAEIDEYLSACDSRLATIHMMERVADFIQKNPKATKAELAAAIKGGAAR